MEFSKCEGTCKNKQKQIVKTEFLKLYPKYYFNVLRTPKLRIFHRHYTSYNTDIVVQDNAAQQLVVKYNTGCEYNFKYW